MKTLFALLAVLLKSESGGWGFRQGRHPGKTRPAACKAAKCSSASTLCIRKTETYKHTH